MRVDDSTRERTARDRLLVEANVDGEEAAFARPIHELVHGRVELAPLEVTGAARTGDLDLEMMTGGGRKRRRHVNAEKAVKAFDAVVQTRAFGERSDRFDRVKLERRASDVMLAHLDGYFMRARLISAHVEYVGARRRGHKWPLMATWCLDCCGQKARAGFGHVN